ncbi:MAG TPA: 23S rRNA (uracil(1939)-C(5))-methyltransferase RlmD [Solirubrobacteraceae bacterium]|jgi:23S rRNA (uracil1939-C5)-methyltransferase|nr:23S rRNA (uracil(1939)-C(5))-methyltransferase RlmD [Solirubrobacteraceae bacterium]
MSTTPTTQARPQRGDELELTIDALAFGGAGVARTEGYVVFVTGALPGDRVRAVITKRKRAYAEARTIEILVPSPDRIAPVATHPGAPWQVLAYDRQLEVKQSQVEEALRRIGKLDGFALEPIIPAVSQWRYRNKLEYSFGTDDTGRVVCGFHAPGRWDEIVAIDDCLLGSERANAAREQIVSWCREQQLSVYDRRSGEGVLRNLVVREGRRTGAIQARLVTSNTPLDTDSLSRAGAGLDGLLWTRQPSVAETTQGGVTELLAGADRFEEQLGGMRFEISAEAFFQTNTEMAERLYELAVDYAQPSGFERLYDLYCGIGTIGLLMSPRVAELWGLELVPEAIADAIANARANEIDNAHFFAGDVRLALRELVERAGRPDVLVLDPPRAGLSQKVVRRIIEASPSRIVYVSCNPTTLAPNAAQLVEAGYELVRVRPVDMFPQTPHIECVAELARRR